MEKTTYIIGHRNPDTDSIVSAVAYAHLKHAQGLTNCLPARAGNANPQTEYIFHRFGVPLPDLLPDLNPQVGFYLSGTPLSIDQNASLRDGMERVEKTAAKGLPIVDERGRYLSMLHYQAFSKGILDRINPSKKAIIPTTVDHLVASIHAQPVLTFDPATVFKGILVIAASSVSALERIIRAEPLENLIAIVGDREDVQERVINLSVRVLVITGAKTIRRELKTLAEQHRVSVLLSPFDTSSTVLLTLYSSPVRFMGDAAISPVHLDTPIRRVRQALSDSPVGGLPVIDDNGLLAGVLTQADLLKEPNIEIILVDHNELSQSLEGIEHYCILEVIDHHRLGTFSTANPILFVNRCVGATSTIIASMFRAAHLPIPRPIASLLLCGILADTLGLQSATTSDEDRNIADYLSQITDLDIPALSHELLTVASRVAGLPAPQLIDLDQKTYTAADRPFSISQIETVAPQLLLNRRDEIQTTLASVNKDKKYYFTALLVTDVTQLDSYLFIDAPAEFFSLIKYPEIEPRVYLLKDVLSRKKQLLPYFFALFERLQ